MLFLAANGLLSDLVFLLRLPLLPDPILTNSAAHLLGEAKSAVALVGRHSSEKYRRILQQACRQLL